MFWRKEYLYSSCKTGKVSYELDRHSESCQYISSYNCKNNKRNCCVSLETDKKPFISKILGVLPLENEPYMTFKRFYGFL